MWNLPLNQASISGTLAGGTLFIYWKKLFMAAMKQPLGEGAGKQCVLVRVGWRADPRRDFPRGRGARLRPLAADSTHPRRKQVWEGLGVWVPSHCVFRALKKHQPSGVPNLHTQFVALPRLGGSLPPI